MTKPSFRAWLRAQRGREDMVGDLARDALADRELPRRLTPARLRARMVELRACEDALEALSQAAREFAERRPTPN